MEIGSPALKARLCLATSFAMLATAAGAQGYYPYAQSQQPYRQPYSYPQQQPYGYASQPTYPPPRYPPQQTYSRPQPYPQQPVYPQQRYPAQQQSYAPQTYPPQTYPHQTYTPPQTSLRPTVCCTVAEGTEVALQLTKTVGAKDAKAGDAVSFRLAAPLIVEGQIVLPKGTPGHGKVVQSSGPGAGGKGAKLVLSADVLDLRGATLPLKGLQLAGAGKDHSFAADMVSMAGWVSLPLSLAGFIVPGGDIEIPEGTNAVAKVAKSVSLKGLGPASGPDYALVSDVFGDRDTARGKITISPPPPGQGKVVFFRASSFGAAAYNVREDGNALGRLSGGSWFSVPLKPGLHSFTASSEPEFKDSLTLKIDPGETYFVEGALTHGVLIGAADLTPSIKSRFDGLFGIAKVASPTAKATPRG